MLRVHPALIGAVANAAYYLVIGNHITDRDPHILTAPGFFLSAVLLLVIASVWGGFR